MLPLFCSVLAIAIGTWLALVATLRFVRSAPSGVNLGGQIGAAAMALPGFWLSIFIGAPFFSGMAIEFAGGQGMRVGALLGAGLTQFACVALGSAVGTSLSLVYHWVARRPSASR